MINDIKIGLATLDDLNSWIELVQLVCWNFPGLETQELLNGYKDTVIKNIKRNSAICAKKHDKIVGILLFSTKYNMLCCMAVHPEYRKTGIASGMIKLMLEYLDKSRDIAVITFRADDEKGLAPRALYKKLGFEEAELCYDSNYPEQKFILYAK